MAERQQRTVPRAVEPAGNRDERLAALVAQGNLVARYLEAHGRWETHTVRTAAGTLNPRVFTPCACAVCADALVALKLEE